MSTAISIVSWRAIDSSTWKLSKSMLYCVSKIVSTLRLNDTYAFLEFALLVVRGCPRRGDVNVLFGV